MESKERATLYSSSISLDRPFAPAHVEVHTIHDDSYRKNASNSGPLMPLSLRSKRHLHQLIEIEGQNAGITSIASMTEALLDATFDEADVDNSHTIDLKEFAVLFEILCEGASDRLNGSEDLKRRRLSRRAVLCAQRIIYYAHEVRNRTSDLPEGVAPEPPPSSVSTFSRHSLLTRYERLTHAQRLLAIAPGGCDLTELATPLPTRYLSEQLAAFQVACRHNDGILEVVRLRRFHMISSMQGSEQSENDDDNSKSSLKWNSLLTRILKYTEDNFMNLSELETVLRCFFVLQTYLTFARAKGKNEAVQAFGDMDEVNRKDYVSIQDHLDALGLTTILANILMTVEERSLRNAAVKLFTELLNGGNMCVQRHLFR